MDECDNCHAQPWKYRFTEERSPGVQRSLCERCYVEALQTTPGVYEVKMRQATDSE
jgi:hypothetical protein